MLVERSMNEQWLSNTYLVADRAGGKAVFVDAGGPLDPLIEKASQLRLSVEALLVTHRHHDHVCDLAVLRAAFPQAELLGHSLELDHLPELPNLQPCRALEPEGAFRIGDLEILPLHLPGHTSGMLAFAVNDEVVFTGDTLFRRSVGGLRAPGHTTFADLKRSIMERLMKLPLNMEILPGHTGSSTVASEWETNPFIRIWRDLDGELDQPCVAFGKPATLVLLAPDYDGGKKAWIRWPDGSDDIVPGSQLSY